MTVLIAVLADSLSADPVLLKMSASGFLAYWMLCGAILWRRGARPRGVAMMVLKWGSAAVAALTLIAIPSVYMILTDAPFRWPSARN